MLPRGRSRNGSDGWDNIGFGEVSWKCPCVFLWLPRIALPVGCLLCSASVKGLKCGAGPGARCGAHAKLTLRFRNSRSTTELLAGGVTVLGARGPTGGVDLLPDGRSGESGGDAKERVLIPLSPPVAFLLM